MLPAAAHEDRNRQAHARPHMKRIRQLHLWLGILFSPLIIFFAFSGALQTFNLHDSEKSGSYVAPAWIAKIAEVHKNQRLVHERGVPPSLLLKGLVALMAVGLIVSSVSGIYMAFRFGRDRRLIWGLLTAGIVLPALLLLCH